MTKRVPYVSNPDNASCGQAVQGMIMQHFGLVAEAGGQLFAYLDEAVHARPDKWTWDHPRIMNMCGLGFRTVAYALYDLPDFVEDAPKAMRDYFGEEVAVANEEYSDMETAIADARALLDFESPLLVKRLDEPDMGDLVECLRENFLVSVTLNYKALRGRAGYAGHTMLAHACDGSHITFHNPGGYVEGAPMHHIPDHRISMDALMPAMIYPATGRFCGFTAYRKA